MDYSKIKYMHVERLSTDEVESLLNGKVYIFPKIDGTNGVIWYDKENNKVKAGSRKKDFFDFFNIYSFTDKNFLHFMIKHPYEENWDTEIKEDYFSTPWENMINSLYHNNYVSIYMDNYSIPFLNNYIKKTFNIVNKYNTHCSIILKRGNMITEETKLCYRRRFWFIYELSKTTDNFLICSEKLAYAFLWELCERIQEEMTYPERINLDRFLKITSFIQSLPFSNDDKIVEVARELYNMKY